MYPDLPPPADLDVPVRDLVGELVDRLGRSSVVEVCADLLSGADRQAYPRVLPYLTGKASVHDDGRWRDYWFRVWGARGLLYVWDDSASAPVVDGLRDPHWRVAEMCTKVARLREIGQAGDGVAALVSHELPRVRAAALRALAVIADTEHVDAAQRAVEDPEADVRRAAVRALRLMSRRLDLDLDVDLE